VPIKQAVAVVKVTLRAWPAATTLTTAPSCSRFLREVRREGPEAAYVDPLSLAHPGHSSFDRASNIENSGAHYAALYSLSDWYKISGRSVVEGNYGIRIKQVISRQERLRTLY
jgi:hypothetical protein